MADQIVMEVARYAPEQDEKPSFQTFKVPFRTEWVVLDALNYIKDKLDGTLTYRWSCRMGICGSCGMMVNGEPKLTCATFLSSYANHGKVRVEPLRYFPVVRDLVTELGDFLAKLGKVKPWLIRKEEQPVSAGEYLQTPEQLENLNVHYVKTINEALRVSLPAVEESAAAKIIPASPPKDPKQDYQPTEPVKEPEPMHDRVLTQA